MMPGPPNPNVTFLTGEWGGRKTWNDAVTFSRTLSVKITCPPWKMWFRVNDAPRNVKSNELSGKYVSPTGATASASKL